MKNHTTMTDEQRAAHEAATIEAMHTGDYSAPDLEYTPITDPLPAVVSGAELAALRRIADSVRRAYAMYHATALQIGVQPWTFDVWFAAVTGQALP